MLAHFPFSLPKLHCNVRKNKQAIEVIRPVSFSLDKLTLIFCSSTIITLIITALKTRGFWICCKLYNKRVVLNRECGWSWLIPLNTPQTSARCHCQLYQHAGWLLEMLWAPHHFSPSPFTTGITEIPNCSHSVAEWGRVMGIDEILHTL